MEVGLERRRLYFLLLFNIVVMVLSLVSGILSKKFEIFLILRAGCAQFLIVSMGPALRIPFDLSRLFSFP